MLDQGRAALRQLEAHHRVGVAQVAGETRMIVGEATIAKHLEHPPRQQGRREGRLVLDVHQLADLRP
jgi:hypothetical protein